MQCNPGQTCRRVSRIALSCIRATKLVERYPLARQGSDAYFSIEFVEGEKAVIVRSTFDTESTNPVEMQRQGWQAILDNFARRVEAR